MFRFLTFSLLISIILSSCLKPTFYRRMDKSAIPADIKKENYVLLVSSFNDKPLDNPNNRQVAKLMQENYPGKFEVIHASQVHDKKYNDKSVYRYFLEWSGSYSSTKSGTGQVINSSSQVILYISDRSNGKVTDLRESLPTYAKALKYFGQYVKTKM